uniref:Uncharacterized protein n=1 Tax=Spongospora subterranea TaxID=70186 RepID=A0A0H5R751_9EUKA|eukprot:CRZ09960.1 hypothetical protein [Spongospora subterranea]
MDYTSVTFSLTSTGTTREVIDANRAAILIQELSVDLWRKVSHLHLSGKSLSIGAAELICRDALSVIEQGALRHAHLNDIIASLPESEALQVLSAIAKSLSVHGFSLEGLDLSDNALGLKGVDAVAPLLTSCRDNLKSLSFNNNGLEGLAAKQISHLMTDGAQQSTQLEKFHTFNNLLESAGAIGLSTLLSMSPSLTDLRISSTRIGVDGALAIATACQQSGALLNRIDFADNNFMSIGMMALSTQAISRLPSLLHLNVCATGMGLQGLEALVEALETSQPGLLSLDISCNELPSESAPFIGRLIRTLLPTLSEFRASENELSSSGAIAVAEAIRDSTVLKVLDLSVNEITESGAMALASSLPSSLKVLELNGNLISAAGLGALTAALSDQCVLGDMDLNDDEYEDAEESEEDDDKDEDEKESPSVDDIAESVQSLNL